MHDDEAILVLARCGIEVLSLDCDIRTWRSGYDVAKWTVENNRWPREVRFDTSNPVGRFNM